jgi:hypothetical protein
LPSSGVTDGSHAPALYAPPDGALGGPDAEINRRPQGSVSSLYHDARKTDQHDLDRTQLIDTSARPVHVSHSNADPRDGRGELAQLHAQLPPDVRQVVGAERDSRQAQVSRTQRRIPASR